jgi:hypothetical protein
MMTKSQFLLSVAARCVGHGEGANFEFSEIIDHDANYVRMTEKYFGGKFPKEEDLNEVEDEETLWKPWRLAQKEVQKEVIAYLYELSDKLKPR